jgi:hypothetical protein
MIMDRLMPVTNSTDPVKYVIPSLGVTLIHQGGIESYVEMAPDLALRLHGPTDWIIRFDRKGQ